MRMDRGTLSWSGLITLLVILGILAGVGIPAFKKYHRKTLTLEAATNLRRIYDGEIAYYNTERRSSILPRQFVSAEQEPTAPPSPQKLIGNWNQDSWRALKFNPGVPVLFRYSAVTSGRDKTSAFTVRAVSDLDGDGVTCLLERSSRANSETGEVEAGGGLYTEMDLKVCP